MNTLYRCYDKHDQLLYIGTSMRPFQRLQQHKEDTVWHNDVVKLTQEHYSTLKKARAAEARAIAKEKPSMNRQGINGVSLLDKKLRRRLRARKGRVIFIECQNNPGLKEWVEARSSSVGRSMSGEVVAILEEKRAAEPG